MATALNQPIDSAWAWARFEPDSARPWTLALAGHLHRRAGFGANWDQLQRSLADGPQSAVTTLVRPSGDLAAFNRQYDEYEVPAGGGDTVDELRAWWLRRMICTPHPLLEKMTLFWHGHFAASNSKVAHAHLMQLHLKLLRQHALGSFRSLLDGIVQDPAMFLTLEAKANRKSMPEENFPRWLMEAFTLGSGHYSEKDLKEAARAFTGWFVLQDELREIPREHDPELKRILGQEGRFTSTDVARILLDQPATAQTIVRKLYRWLIAETQEPDPRLIAPLAESFAKNYDLSQLVETMLRSNLFFSPAAYRQRMKSPVEYAVGIVRGLEEPVATLRLGEELARLGQSLLHPPTVKGWAGGLSWINHATLAGRQNLAAALTQAGGAYGEKIQPLAVAKKHGFSTTDTTSRFFVDLFLQGDAAPEAAAPVAEKDPEQAVRQMVYRTITLPEFQLA